MKNDSMVLTWQSAIVCFIDVRLCIIFSLWYSGSDFFDRFPDNGCQIVSYDVSSITTKIYNEN